MADATDGVFRALLDRLITLGVERVFGVVGDGNVGFVRVVDEASRLRPDAPVYVRARHEAGAVSMADGFARMRRTVAVATLTQGPGLANAVTALATASRHRTPLLVVVGDLDDGQRSEHLQWIDQSAMLSAAGVSVVRADGRTPGAAEVAVARAAAGETVVLGVTPAGRILDAELRPEGGAPGAEDAPPLDDRELTDLLTLVERSVRPLVLAGAGGIQAREELIGLAERLGAPLLTTVQAKGLFTGAPSALGVVGGFATEATKRVTAQADLVLAFGAGLNRYTVDHGAAFGDAQIVAVDPDPDPLRRSPSVAPRLRRVLADGRLTAARLSAGVGVGSGARTAWWPRPEPETSPGAASGLLHPKAAMLALGRLLPPDRVLVVEGGSCVGWPCTYLDVQHPDDFVFGMDFGAIGVSTALAAGVAFARPDRTVVAVAGDGGFMMGIADLDTVARYRLPILFVVLNDECLGIEALLLRGLQAPTDPADYADGPTLQQVVSGFGIRAVRVTTLDELEAALSTTITVPTLLDLRIDGSIRPEWLRR
ncbi:MAG: Acetolactate synthase large subunit [Frankiales bacterium]|nr:Acetolactate synthase large subunit [Frankiales bacterium]